MNTVGLFFPLAGSTLVESIPVNTGANGLVEVINLTNNTLIITIFGLGAVYLAGRTQAIYKLGAAAQGAQMVTVGIGNNQGTNTNQSIQPISPFQPVDPLPFGDQGVTVYINAYQEGEIEWYPPFSLGSPSLQAFPNSYAVAQETGAAGSATVFVQLAPPLPPFTVAYALLYGFDISYQPGSSQGTNTLTLDGMVKSGSNPLTYGVESPATNTVFFLSEKFVPPLLSSVGNTGVNTNSSIFFTVPSIFLAPWNLNIYATTILR